MKDVQATGEAFSPPEKRTFNIWKHEISSLFLLFSHSWIRIQPTKIDAGSLWIRIHDNTALYGYYLLSPINSLDNNACRTYLTSYARRWSLTLRAGAWENRMLLLRGTYSNFSAGNYYYHRCSGSGIFWYGSGDAESYLWLTDPAPDFALFACDLFF